MSNVSSVMTALNTAIATALPKYDQLSDSLDRADNTNLWLDKGFATAYGAGENATAEFCDFKSQIVDRTFQVMLTNIYAPTLDPNYRRELEGLLMDDQWTLRSAILGDPYLGGVAMDARFVSDSGIEYLENDNKQFIIIMSNFTIKYQERA